MDCVHSHLGKVLFFHLNLLPTSQLFPQFICWPGQFNVADRLQRHRHSTPVGFFIQLSGWTMTNGTQLPVEDAEWNADVDTNGQLT